MSEPSRPSVRGIGLKGRLILGFLLVGAIPFVMLGWYGYGRTVDVVVEGTGHRLQEAAVTSGDIIDRNLFGRFSDAQAFASNPSALGAPAQRERIITDFTTAYGVYDLMLVVDADGAVVGANEVDHTGAPVDTSSLIGRDVSAEDWFTGAIGDDAPGGTWYGEAEISPLVTEVYGQERLGLGFSAPIYNQFGDVAGVWYNVASFDRVVVEVMADTRASFIEQGLESIETQVLRSDGLVLDDADAAAVLSLNLVEAGLEAGAAATGERGDNGVVVESNGRRGVEQINGWAVTDGAVGFPGYGWGILVRQDVEEAVRALDGIRSSIILIGVATLAVVAVVGWALARGVARPLRRQADLLADVAGGDLSIRLDTRSGGEVGQIAHAINTALAGVGSTMASVDQTAMDLASSASDLTGVSREMAEAARSTSTQAAEVSATAEEISVTSESVSKAMEQMSSSVQEISDNTSEAARVSAQAVEVTIATRERMEALEASASDIGNVVSVITSIAEQTDLLALNATIEAARVGEAGKGFAVVANEVKALASQTSTATDEIQAKIEAIQHDSVAAVQAIADISKLIDKVNEASTTIAGAVEEQSTTTKEVSVSLQAVTRGTSDISASIGGVAVAADTATGGADQTRESASHLAELASELNRVLSRFELADEDAARLDASSEGDTARSTPVSGLEPSPISEQGSRPIGEQGSRPIGEQGSRPIGEQGSRPIGEQGSRPSGVAAEGAPQSSARPDRSADRGDVAPVPPSTGERSGVRKVEARPEPSTPAQTGPADRPVSSGRSASSDEAVSSGRARRAVAAASESLPDPGPGRPTAEEPTPRRSTGRLEELDDDLLGSGWR